MSATEFLSNFLKDAPADRVRHAASLVTGRDFPNATAAKDALRASMHRPDAVVSAARMLGAYNKPALQEWCDDIGAPRFRKGLGDFTPEALRELGGNNSRNRTIVEHWLANRERFGKTIVFACDLAHADALEKLFRARGVEACAIHSGYDNAENRASLQAFHDGRVEIILGVAMLTLGIDVPDAQTVVLARPTHSDILYAQMIGRGARRTPTKTSFHIVEFTDNVENHHAKLVSARTFFQGAGRAVQPPPAGPRVIMQAPPTAPTDAPTKVGSGEPSVFRSPPEPGGVTIGTASSPVGQTGDLNAPKVTLRCASCAGDVGAFKFCPHCGTAVVRAPTSCATCKSPWIAGHKFCGECGAPAA